MGKVVGDLNRLKVSQDWSDNGLFKYIFRCLFTDMKSNFYNKVNYLKPFVKNEKDMILLCMCIEMVIHDNQQYNDIVHVLNGFYECELLEEDVIIKWFNSKSKVVPVEIDNQIKNNAQSFIYWLENAEYETNL